MMKKRNELKKPEKTKLKAYVVLAGTTMLLAPTADAAIQYTPADITVLKSNVIIDFDDNLVTKNNFLLIHSSSTPNNFLNSFISFFILSIILFSSSTFLF